jgi:hypothetical protein
MVAIMPLVRTDIATGKTVQEGTPEYLQAVVHDVESMLREALDQIAQLRSEVAELRP